MRSGEDAKELSCLTPTVPGSVVVRVTLEGPSAGEYRPPNDIAPLRVVLANTTNGTDAMSNGTSKQWKWIMVNGGKWAVKVVTAIVTSASIITHPDAAMAVQAVSFESSCSKTNYTATPFFEPDPLKGVLGPSLAGKRPEAATKI